MINTQYIRKRFKGWTLSSIGSNTKTKRKRNIPTKSVVINAFSKGKIIVIQTASFYLHIHLGISGWLVPRKPKIYKYALELCNNDRKSITYIKDRRSFSSINVYQAEHLTALDTIGVDILSTEFTLDYFQTILLSRKRNICALLMDQTLYTGLGNYIKNEAQVYPAQNKTKSCDPLYKDAYLIDNMLFGKDFVAVPIDKMLGDERVTETV